MNGIIITVNGKNYEVDGADTTISRLLELCQVESPEMVAVQRNGTFVARDAYDSTTLVAGDDVEFLFFMGGGR